MMQAMDKDLLTEMHDYCRRAGISPSTLCVRAIGNSRYPGRLQRRIEKAETDADKIRSYMVDNPPPIGE